MQVTFTFRHVEPSEALKTYARDKIAKFQKYLRSPLEADVILSTERHLHCVELSVRADGERFAGSVESEDMYASIDKVIDKVDRQVRDSKAAANHRKRHSGGVSQLAGKQKPEE
ncbi:MAG: ribosome-associated translation inhibitor RaiA [Sandaracinaceae bacterium]|nr:ribosome-associated translation inhibitor RaiA [Sandaracinaceae bacterium]